MDRFNRKTKQLTLALAAMAIVAVAAVMLLAGGVPAQATTATVAPDGGSSNLLPQQTDPTPTTTPTPTPGPVRALPVRVACSPNPATVVDSGHIALFDVYWNPEELELTNNPCPPTVTHVPEQTPVPPGPGNPDGTPGSPERNDLSPSTISIDAEPPTIIHIPSSAQITLTEAEYPKDKYRDLWNADNTENRGTDADDMPVGDGIVWMLPACPPAGNAAAEDLCISVSAALLNAVDWDGDIEFLLDHIHQTDIDKQDARYVLAYDVPASDASGQLDPLWNSSNVRKAIVEVAPGQYRRPMWFFTDRGTYEFQVHITGAPETDPDLLGDLAPLSTDESVSSDKRDYIVHVGAEADLSVEVSAEQAGTNQEALKPGDSVTITVTASNDGPDDVPNAQAEVSLPDGLTYSYHTPATDTFADSDGDGVRTWDAGSLASGASKTLTIGATVDADTHGHELATMATISATEPVRITEIVDGVNTPVTYHVPVPDQDPDNNSRTATMTVSSRSNVDPHWNVLITVEENTPGGTPIGDKLWVFDSEGDTLTFEELTDEQLDAIPLAPYGVNGAELFTHSATRDGNFTGVQIEVESGASLDHETTPVYFLAMAVRDSKQAQGNTNETIDDVLVIIIRLADVVDDAQDLEFSAASSTVALGENATFTLQLHAQLPDGATDFVVGVINGTDASLSIPDTSDHASGTYTWTIAGPDKAGDVSYEAFAKYSYGEDLVIVESDPVTVTWTGSSSN